MTVANPASNPWASDPNTLEKFWLELWLHWLDPL